MYERSIQAEHKKSGLTSFDRYEKQKNEAQQKSITDLLKYNTFSERLYAIKAFGNDYYTLSKTMSIGKMMVEIELILFKRLVES